MIGPVERLLARTPAEGLIGAIQPALEGELPWSFSYGARAKRHSLTIVIVALLGILVTSAAAVLLAIGNGWDPQRMMALSLVAYLVLSMAVPKLLGRKRRGAASWERQVMIDQTHVRVIDRYGDRSMQWRQPLKTYRDVRHRVVKVAGKRFAGASTPIALDVVELRHQNPGRCIYLRGCPRGGQGPTGLGREVETERGETPAATPSPLDGVDAQGLDQLLERVSATLDLPVSRAGTGEESLAGA